MTSFFSKPAEDWQNKQDRPVKGFSGIKPEPPDQGFH